MSKKGIKKRSQKSISEGVRKIFSKADARIKSGQDTFSADWQATLELYLFIMHEHLVANPGQLHPMQIDGQDEWDFYLDIQKVADLPPDTCALLMTPSAFKSISVPKVEKQLSTATLKGTVYSLIISGCNEHKKIMQVALPGIKSYGIDVFEEGKHFADYTYNTKEECIDDLPNAVWTFWGHKGQWTREQLVRYTENWYAKSIDNRNMEDVKFHTDYSYVHHPELLNLTPSEAVFKLIRATVPKEYDSLEKAISIANDLNRDFNLGEVDVTKAGILSDKKDECQALIGRIAVEIDLNLELLECLDGIKMPDRQNPEFRHVFDEAAKDIYRKITERSCPESVNVF
jgi:hypothetical protein